MKKTSFTSKLLSVFVSVTLVLGLNPGLAFATTDSVQDSDGGTELPVVSIVEDASVVASGGCGASGSNLTWVLDDTGVLSIEGTGAMANFTYEKSSSVSTNIPWYNYRSQITEVAIAEGATSVGTYAFCDCTALTTVTLPDTMLSIGNYALGNCSALTSLNIPASVSTMGSNVYEGCSKLKTASPTGFGGRIQYGWTQTIPANAFASCTALTVVSLPDELSSIGQSAFDGCESLAAVILPDTLESINNWAFRDCSSLSQITFLGDAPTMDSEIFSGVTAAALYALDDTTWTSSVRQDYGGEITWIGFDEDFNIDISSATVAEIENQTYTGSEIKPEPEVTLLGIELTADTDYTLSYANNTNVGTATITITGTGSYTGSKQVQFTIEQAQGVASFEASQVSKTVGDASFTNSLTNISGGSATYSSSNASVATVNSSTGEVTIQGAGKTTITVNVAATKNYTACSASYTLTVSSGELNPRVAYSTHIQNIGWNQGTMRDGEMAGTSGLAYRLEGIKISLENLEGVSGGIEYRTHVENLGWQSYVADGTMSGTTGMAYRLEAINIRLTGNIAEFYDVYYRVHAENIGWMGWAKNDEEAGTAGYSYRLEAIQIVLVEKGGAAPTDVKDIKSVVNYAFTSKSDGPSSPYRDELVSYNTHVQNIGWQEYSKTGGVAGTSGLAYRLEGIHIQLGGAAAALNGSIEYTTHVQNKGWLSYVADGKMSGTSGEALRLEAIQIRLTDEVEEAYDVYYRVHAQNLGWMGWAKNDAQAGTSGYAYRLEAIQIVLVEKGGEAPGSTYGGITSNITDPFIKA